MAEQDLHISSRLKKLLPPLTDEERKQLQANILSDGQLTDPILYWFDGAKNVVMDGMHRWPIVRNTDIPYSTKQVESDSYEDAELWVLNHQLGRRNLLSPQGIRKVRGELYNRLKRQDGGHGDQGADRQNVGPKPAAETIAKAAGVGPRTVERDGASIAALAKCTTAIQKGINSDAFKASAAELQTLSKLADQHQDNIASDLRKDRAKTVTAAMKLRKIKAPAPKTKAKPPAKKKLPKKLDKKAYYKQWTAAIGPVVRLVDKIANGVGEKNSKPHKFILVQLENCTKEMDAWMRVK